MIENCMNCKHVVITYKKKVIYCKIQELQSKNNLMSVCILCLCVLDTHLEDKMSKEKSLEKCPVCPVQMKTQFKKNSSLEEE